MATTKPNLCGYDEIYVPDEECDCCDVLQAEIDAIWDRIIHGTGNVLVDSTENWESQVGLVGEKNTVYVYTDHSRDDYNEPVPAYKVGDGLAYLADLPFSDVRLDEHINNVIRHITSTERTFWNNKVRAYMDNVDTEKLVLSDN